MKVLGVILSLAFCVAPISAETQVKFDCHGHCFSPKQLLSYFPERMAGVSASTSEEQLIEQTMQEYNKHRIVLALVSGNDRIFDAWIKQYPNRILRSFSPDFGSAEFMNLDHDAESQELKRRIKSGEIRALGELTMPYAKVAINTKVMWPYYRVAEEEGIPVFIHTGQGPRGDQAKFGHPRLLEDIAKAFPNLTIVACHSADMLMPDLIKVMKAHENVCADNSVTNWSSKLYCSMVLRAYKREKLIDRVLFGSDQMVYPGLVSKAIDNMNSSGLTDEDLRKVYWENPCRIFGVTASEMKALEAESMGSIE